MHDLGILIAKLPPDTEPVFGYELAALSEFASVRRYEEGRITLTLEEAEDVLATAEEVLEWARGLVEVPS